MTDSPRPDIQAINTWLVREGLFGTPFQTLLEQMCEQLVAAGVPLLRVNFSMRAHHPEVGAFAYRWKRASGVVHERYDRNAGNEAATGWDKSPLRALLEGTSSEMRHRLMPADAPFAYPVFEELIEQGATDYFATQLAFDRSANDAVITPSNLPSGMMISWSADAPDGFSDQALEDLRAVVPVLGLALKSNSNYLMAQDLLATYLGGDASGRVMSGALSRGSLDAIEAVIIYFDLQGFTKLSEAMAGPDIIEMLNDYFGVAVPLIEARGGNVLKFMGDGVLAIFARTEVENAESAAIETICDLRRAIAEVNLRREGDGLRTTGFCIATHAGNVLYGNIGSSKRLDFTVIGPAVNTTARLLGMCSAVDQTVVIGANVARPLLDSRSDLVSLGRYALRGVAERQELFTLD